MGTSRSSFGARCLLLLLGAIMLTGSVGTARAEEIRKMMEQYQQELAAASRRQVGGVDLAELPAPGAYLDTSGAEGALWLSGAEIALLAKEAAQEARREFYETTYSSRSTGPKAEQYRAARRAIDEAEAEIGATTAVLATGDRSVLAQLGPALTALQEARRTASVVRQALAPSQPLDRTVLEGQVRTVCDKLDEGIGLLETGQGGLQSATERLKEARAKLAEAWQSRKQIDDAVDAIQDDLRQIARFSGEAADAIWDGQFRKPPWPQKLQQHLTLAHTHLRTLEAWAGSASPPEQGWNAQWLVLDLAALQALQVVPSDALAREGNTHLFTLDIPRVMARLRGCHITFSALMACGLQLRTWQLGTRLGAVVLRESAVVARLAHLSSLARPTVQEIVKACQRDG